MTIYIHLSPYHCFWHILLPSFLVHSLSLPSLGDRKRIEWKMPGLSFFRDHKFDLTLIFVKLRKTWIGPALNVIISLVGGGEFLKYISLIADLGKTSNL